MTSIVHRALLYQEQADLVDATVPFLRAGLEADEAILAVLPATHIAALRDALGADAATMDFVDAAEMYRHPVRTIADYHAYGTVSAPRAIRALAEPIWAGRSPTETVEWQRFESIVNVAFTEFTAQIVCLYDDRSLDERALDTARRTHPELLGAAGPRPSGGFVEPAAFNAACDREPLPPRPPGAETLPIDTTDDLLTLRRFVIERAVHRGMARDALNRLLVAVTEVAGNSLRHGEPPHALHLWADDAGLVCEVTDRGHWNRGALQGLVPPESNLTGGFGLWAVRMLTDLVQIRTGAGGTVVRLHVRL